MKGGKKMECPICKSVFSKVKEVLIIRPTAGVSTVLDRWSRLISYPHGGGNYFIEEDFSGEKWKHIKNDVLVKSRDLSP